MVENVFEAPLLKVQRATKFRDELQTELDRYSSTSPCSGRMVKIGEDYKIQINWKGISLVPGAIFGDAIHNLRAALDLASNILVKSLGKNPRDVYFPFSTKKLNFEERLRISNFNKADIGAIEVVRKYRPYKDGNTILWSINYFDIRDKHQSLVPTSHSMQICATGSYDIDNPLAGSVQVSTDNIFYRFPENIIFEGEDIIQKLDEMIAEVKNILSDLTEFVKI